VPSEYPKVGFGISEYCVGVIAGRILGMKSALISRSHTHKSQVQQSRSEPRSLDRWAHASQSEPQGAIPLVPRINVATLPIMPQERRMTGVPQFFNAAAFSPGVAKRAVAGERAGRLPFAERIKTESGGKLDPDLVPSTVVSELPGPGVCQDGKIALRKDAGIEVVRHEVAHALGADEETATKAGRNPGILTSLRPRPPVDGWSIGFEFQTFGAANPKAYTVNGNASTLRPTVGKSEFKKEYSGWKLTDDQGDIEVITDPVDETDGGYLRLMRVMGQIEGVMGTIQTQGNAPKYWEVEPTNEQAKKAPPRLSHAMTQMNVNDEVQRAPIPRAASISNLIQIPLPVLKQIPKPRMAIQHKSTGKFTANPQATAGLLVEGLADLLERLANQIPDGGQELLPKPDEQNGAHVANAQHNAQQQEVPQLPQEPPQQQVPLQEPAQEQQQALQQPQAQQQQQVLQQAPPPIPAPKWGVNQLGWGRYKKCFNDAPSGYGRTHIRDALAKVREVMGVKTEDPLYRGLLGVLELMASYIAYGTKTQTAEVTFHKYVAVVMSRSSLHEVYSRLNAAEKVLYETMLADGTMATALGFESTAQMNRTDLFSRGVKAGKGNLKVGDMVKSLPEKDLLAEHAVDQGIHAVTAENYETKLTNIKGPYDIGSSKSSHNRKGMFVELRKLKGRVPWDEWRNIATLTFDMIRDIHHQAEPARKRRQQFLWGIRSRRPQPFFRGQPSSRRASVP
jgi:hypothetical protein